jgi:hypothetical protein
VADTSPVRRRSVTIAVLSIAGRLVEAGEDTARTEADTVEVDTAVAVNTVAVATAVAVAATVAVAALEGPAPIFAATGTESAPDSMDRRRLSGSHA